MPPREDTPDDDPRDDPSPAHEMPVEGVLDLHAFAPREITEVVRDYLDQAQALGFREVRLVHGKGIGFQRDRVRRVLKSHPAVESFADAPAERGHWGSTVARVAAPDACLLLRATPPRTTRSITPRGIAADEVAALLGPRWARAGSDSSGWSVYRTAPGSDPAAG